MMKENRMSILTEREKKNWNLRGRLEEFYMRLRNRIELQLAILRGDFEEWCWADNRGISTVEVILIIVVLVGLVIVFRDQITKIVNSLFSKITTNVDKI